MVMECVVRQVKPVVMVLVSIRSHVIRAVSCVLMVRVVVVANAVLQEQNVVMVFVRVWQTVMMT